MKYLVNNARTGRDNGKTLESVSSPLEEGEAFSVALHFELKVLVQSIVASILIDLQSRLATGRLGWRSVARNLNRMVDDEVNGH